MVSAISKYREALICLSLVCWCAGQACALEPGPSTTGGDTSRLSNWQWSVVAIEDSTYRTDTLVTYFPQSKKEAEKTADKFCAKLQAEISKSAHASFFDNVPPVGRLVVKVTLKSRLSWNIPIGRIDSRSARIAEATREHTRPPGNDEGLTDDNKQQTRGKSEGYRVSKATVELYYPDNRMATSLDCPIDEHGNPDVEGLAKLIAPDMVRISAAFRAK